MTVYQLEQELELNLADLQHRYIYTIYMNYYNVCIRIVTLYMILTAMLLYWNLAKTKTLINGSKSPWILCLMLFFEILTQRDRVASCTLHAII